MKHLPLILLCLVAFFFLKKKFFDTTDYSRAWDGRDKAGKNVPSGVYLYYLILKTPTNQEVKKSGTVTVLYP